MERDPALLEVGRIGRPHGVRGELYVHLVTDRHERVTPGARLFASGRWLAVTSSRAVPQGWLVHFDGVVDRTAAERLTNAVLYAEPIDDPDEIWIHQLIGARVRDTSGVERGVCVAVLQNPANDLIELDSGALVPVNFLVEIGDDGVAVIDPPAGLFEIYEAD
jgi:16S rRNA processing protein RimM